MKVLTNAWLEIWAGQKIVGWCALRVKVCEGIVVPECVWEDDWLWMVKVRVETYLGGVRAVNGCFMNGRSIL